MRFGGRPVERPAPIHPDAMSARSEVERSTRVEPRPRSAVLAPVSLGQAVVAPAILRHLVDGVPRGRCGRGARFRVDGGRLLCARAPRRVPLSRDDELPVRRTAHDPVRYDWPAPRAAGAVAGRQARGPPVPAPEQHGVVRNSGGERRHAPRAAGSPRLPARLCPREVRGLARQPAAPARPGFQGGLNWFRCHAGPIGRSEIELFAGRAIEVPSSFIAGAADWGTDRRPGAIERMRTTTCTHMEGVHLIEGAGHWVQQEQPERFNAILLDCLRRHPVPG